MCQAESLAIVPGTIPIASIVADSAQATGLKWQAPSSGALTKIVSGSVGEPYTQSTSALNIDNCFSSTYNKYIIYLEMGGSGGTTQSWFRFRDNTTDRTGDYNITGLQYNEANTLTSLGVSPSTSRITLGTLSGENTYTCQYLINVYAGSSNGSMAWGSGITFSDVSGPQTVTFAGTHATNNANGFTLLRQDGSTFYCKYAVYGLEK